MFTLKGAKDIDKIVRELDAMDKDVKVAAVQSLNRTAKFATTLLVSGISSRVKVAAKLIRRKMRWKKAGLKKMSIAYFVGLRPIAVIGIAGVRQTRSGVSVRGHSFPGGFLVEVPRTGKRGAFRRRGAGRYPLEFLEIPVVEAGKEVYDTEIKGQGSVMRKKYFDEFKQALQHRVTKRFQKFMKRGARVGISNLLRRAR